VRHSRWRRRRYYPLFLEQLAKKVYYLLAALDIDIQWIYHASRALKGFSHIDFVPIVIFQPEIAHTYSAIIELGERVIAKLIDAFPEQIICRPGVRHLSGIEKSIGASFHINEIANPFQAACFLFFDSSAKKYYESETASITNFHLRKAAAEAIEFLQIKHLLISGQKPESCFSSATAFLFLLSSGFVFPLDIDFRSKIEGILPSLIVFLALSHKFKFSIPLYFDKIYFSIKPLLLTRGVKFFSESEQEISSFLHPIKLDTEFLLNSPLMNNILSNISVQSRIGLTVLFDLYERRRSPDVIALALRISSFIKYSSPDVIALTLALKENYDLFRQLTPALSLLMYLYERDARSYQFLLDLLVSDVSGDFLIDIYKQVFDLVEAKLLQPAIAKIKI